MTIKETVEAVQAHDNTQRGQRVTVRSGKSGGVGKMEGRKDG